MKSLKNGICNSYLSITKRSNGQESFNARIYFAQCRIDEVDLVKIGIYNGTYKVINNLKSRYKADFTLLQEIPGNSRVEQNLHRKFAHLNHRKSSLETLAL